MPPWEKYQKQKSGPWEKYASSSQLGDIQYVGEADEDRLTDERGIGSKIMDAIYPTARNLPEDAGLFRKVTSNATDAVTLPYRVAASLPELKPGGETFLSAVGRTEGKNMLGDVLRHPSTGATVLGAGPLAKVAGPLIGKLPAGAQAFGTAAAESIPGVVAGQAKNIAEGEGIKPREAGLEMLLGTVIPPAAGAAMRRLGRYSKGLMSKVTEIPEEALEAATDPAVLARAKDAWRRTGGDLSGTAEDLQSRIMDQRNIANRTAQDIEQMKSSAFTEDITGGRRPSAFRSGSAISDAAETAKQSAGSRFGAQQEEIVSRSNAATRPLSSTRSVDFPYKPENEAVRQIDDFLYDIGYNPQKGFQGTKEALGNKAISEKAVNSILSVRDLALKAQNTGETLNARRQLQNMINFGGDNGARLFPSGSDDDIVMKRLYSKFNDIVEQQISDQGGHELAAAWRANNAAEANVINMLTNVQDGIRMGRANAEEYFCKIGKVGINNLSDLKASAQGDEVLQPVFDELKRGFKDNLVAGSMTENGIDYNKFVLAWDNVDGDLKRLMLEPDDLARIEKAIRTYKPERLTENTFGKSILGVQPNAQKLTKTLENIGSKNNRQAIKELEFIDDVIGNEGDQRVSQLAQDYYLGKQLKVTPEGNLPLTNNIRTGKFNWGSMVGGTAGSTLGPIGAAAGFFGGSMIQSPAAAVALYRFLNSSAPKTIGKTASAAYRPAMMSIVGEKPDLSALENMRIGR
jgi:hypothetical protein